ncbi:MAG: hypothetical protein OXN89_23650 [Bryobacterales bacterium]|nr:hypothetical protein [Bryobacterales bacterium]
MTAESGNKGDLVEAEADWIGERLTRAPLHRRVLTLLFPPVNLAEAVCCSVPTVLLVGAVCVRLARGNPVHFDGTGAVMAVVLVVSSWALWRIGAVGWRRWSLAWWRWTAMRLGLLRRD